MKLPLDVPPVKFSGTENPEITPLGADGNDDNVGGRGIHAGHADQLCLSLAVHQREGLQVHLAELACAQHGCSCLPHFCHNSD